MAGFEVDRIHVVILVAVGVLDIEWPPTIGLFKSRMGNPDNPEHREMLTRASPLISAERLRVPMWIAQGANDPRVTQKESEEMVAAIEKNKGAVTYVLHPDEGHGFVRHT